MTLRAGSAAREPGSRRTPWCEQARRQQRVDRRRVQRCLRQDAGELARCQVVLHQIAGDRCDPQPLQHRVADPEQARAHQRSAYRNAARAPTGRDAPAAPIGAVGQLEANVLRELVALARYSMPSEVGRARHQAPRHRAELAHGAARRAQPVGDPDRDVEGLACQIDEPIAEVQLERNLRMCSQKPGRQWSNQLLAQHGGCADAQEAHRNAAFVTGCFFRLGRGEKRDARMGGITRARRGDAQRSCGALQ